MCCKKYVLSLFIFIQILNLGQNFELPVFGRSICLCRCGAVSNTQRQNPTTFPWLAMISTGTEFIEGALISDRHVITAAAPLYGVPYTNLLVSLGVYDRCGADSGQTSSAAAIIINPDYSPTSRAGDLALVKLRYPTQFNDYISPICLPYIGLREDGYVGWTSAWQLGSEAPTCIPTAVTYPFMSSTICLSNGVPADQYTVDKGCLGPLGTTSAVCNLDVGAPVMYRSSSFTSFRLIGIVSSAPSCDQNIAPLYIRISDYLSWIYDNIRLDCKCMG